MDRMDVRIVRFGGTYHGGTVYLYTAFDNESGDEEHRPFRTLKAAMRHGETTDGVKSWNVRRKNGKVQRMVAREFRT